MRLAWALLCAAGAAQGTTCAPPSAGVCHENGYPLPGVNVDDDCCAAAAGASCAPGYEYSRGAVCDRWDGGESYAVCCEPCAAGDDCDPGPGATCARPGPLDVADGATVKDAKRLLSIAKPAWVTEKQLWGAGGATLADGDALVAETLREYRNMAKEQGKLTPEQRVEYEAVRERAAEETGADADSFRDASAVDSLIEERTELRMLVPSSCAGIVIGKGGSVIKDVMMKSGANVKLSNKRDMVPGVLERMVIIRGSLEQQIASAKTIFAIMQHHKR